MKVRYTKREQQFVDILERLEVGSEIDGNELYFKFTGKRPVKRHDLNQMYEIIRKVALKSQIVGGPWVERVSRLGRGAIARFVVIDKSRATPRDQASRLMSSLGMI